MGDLVKLAAGKMTMTSMVIAEEFDRRHSAVLKSIQVLIADGTLGEGEFSLTSRVVPRGKTYPMYELTDRGLLTVLPYVAGEKSKKAYQLLTDMVMKSKEFAPMLKSLIDAIDNLDTHDLPPDRYVYVARESVSGRYKIGISKDPRHFFGVPWM